MAAASQRSTGILRDRTMVAWALGGLVVVTLLTVSFQGFGPRSAYSVAVAAAYAFALAVALLRRSNRHWRRLLARIEEETRRRLSTAAQSSTISPQFFLERLGQECRRSSRYGLEMSVIRLRCDAHTVAHLGDEDHHGAAVLHAAAALLRSEDVFGRLSELEFAFFLPHTNRSGAEIVLNRLGALGELVESLGLAVFGDDAAEPHDLLRAAGADGQRRMKLTETQRSWNQRAVVG